MLLYDPTKENKKLLIKDILDASAHTANINAATILAERSGNILEEILIEKAKANFEKLFYSLFNLLFKRSIFFPDVVS